MPGARSGVASTLSRRSLLSRNRRCSWTNRNECRNEIKPIERTVSPTTDNQPLTTMPTGDLEDLKIAWKELSQQLERQNASTQRQLTENKLARFRFGFRPLLFGQTLQLIVGAIIAAVSGQFWVNHVDTPDLLICGLLLQAYGIMFIAFAVRDLILIRQIDYGAPVIVIQKQLAQL